MKLHSCAWAACLGACAAEPAFDDAVGATEIVRAPEATGQGFHDPNRAINGVRGAGRQQGSLDVYSIGFDEDSELVLGFSGRAVIDGPGVDFVVFENAFEVSGGGVFVDPVIVEVSRDGTAWVPFPHEYRAANPSRASHEPSDWVGFAGITPVLLHQSENPVDPFDAEQAGGDHFDLADLPDTEEAARIARDGFRFVRLTSAAREIDGATGSPYPSDPTSDGPDIDGVIARHTIRADR